MCDQGRKNSLNASVTVEAALIIPLIISIIIALVMVIFYLYATVKGECEGDISLISRFEERNRREPRHSFRTAEQIIMEKSRKGYFSKFYKLFRRIETRESLELTERSVKRREIEIGEKIVESISEILKQ